MEEKEPGYKARRAKEAADREARHAVERAAILQQFGTAEAYFAFTPREAALVAAGTPFARREQFKDWYEPYPPRTYTVELGGFRDGDVFPLDRTAPETIAAISTAYPIPEPLRGIIDEYQDWETLRRGRGLFVDGEYRLDMEAELRCEILRNLLNNRPVASWDDMQARFDWKLYEWKSQWIDDQERNDPDLDRLEDDFRALRALYESATLHGAQSVHQTTAQRRAAVLSMLDAHPELSSREIARRAGVSPQTVSNLRKGKSA